MLKRRRPSLFVCDVVEFAIQPRNLIYRKWLDFGKSAIDWEEEWADAFNATLERRIARRAPSFANGSWVDPQVLTLVELTETMMHHMKFNGTYKGNVELQIICSSIISCRMTNVITYGSDRSVGSFALSLLSEIPSELYDAPVMEEFRKRVATLWSPIIDGYYLVYSPGQVMGIDKIINY